MFQFPLLRLFCHWSNAYGSPVSNLSIHSRLAASSFQPLFEQNLLAVASKQKYVAMVIAEECFVFGVQYFSQADFRKLQLTVLNEFAVEEQYWPEVRDGSSVEIGIADQAFNSSIMVHFPAQGPGPHCANDAKCSQQCWPQHQRTTKIIPVKNAS